MREAIRAGKKPDDFPIARSKKFVGRKTRRKKK
jgi:hypothetical protein